MQYNYLFLGIPCTFLTESKYIQCGALSQEACQIQDPCSGSCIWNNCTYNDLVGTDHNAFGMCLPYSASSFEINQRCLSNQSNAIFFIFNIFKSIKWLK